MSSRVPRACAAILLALHFLLHFTPFAGGVWVELVLYNLIPGIGLVIISTSKQITDRLSQPLLIAAISFWMVGSAVASASSFFLLPGFSSLMSNIFYLLFYPCAIIALPRLISTSQKSTVLEVFDASIVGLGLGVLGTALILKPVLPHFGGNLVDAIFSLTFPISDLLLVSLTVTSILSNGFSYRTFYLSMGIFFFAVTDLLFLWQHLNGRYSFASVLDDGWLLGILLIAESTHHRNNDSATKTPLDPIYIALSIFLSATLLALIAIKPGYLPTYVLIPSLSVLLLAFVRMTIALRQARNIGTERILARTDELTGLPNRRKLISEIESFIDKNGSLLLLDLDGFKPINDMYGHEVGDKVLQQTSLRFSRALPHGALLARLGGDEFGVLIEGAYEHSMEVALALKATLSYPFKIDSHSIIIGVSIGVAENTGAPDLLRRADDAMYRAKREGLGVCQL